MTEQAASRVSILKSTAAAAGVALALLVTVVMPAEYGVDPLGTGKLIGLDGMAASEISALGASDGPWHSDRHTFELRPFESVEYKYRLPEGAAIVFSWTATLPVEFDMHSEPDDGPEGYAETFDRGRAPARYGEYRAPFPGIHGWFWENRSQQVVTIELRAAGFFESATLWEGGLVVTERFGTEAE